jgi:hypothetical protein
VLVVVTATLVLIVITDGFRVFTARFNIHRGTIYNGFPIFWLISVTSAASTVVAVRGLKQRQEHCVITNHFLQISLLIPLSSVLYYPGFFHPVFFHFKLEGRAKKQNWD